MVSLYILRNNKNRYYIGITQLDPIIRLKRHNNGHVYSTKFGRPWKLIHVEKYENMIEARKREKQIKSWKGGNAFKNFPSKSGESSNGRTLPFGGKYPGSSPGSPDLDGK